MSKLSVIIPSRDERFLIPTIDDIFKHASQEIEVVAVLDSNLWPEGWKEVTERHVNLTTIHNGGSLGMRASINRGVASAISRGATYIAKSDGHCAFSEGFDEVLKAEMDDDWIVVPRRLRLDPENWTISEPEKPPYDYHYLSFPDDPNDFGGPGLNGKPWPQRQQGRADILLDDEMSSQGSFWACRSAYFEKLELMNDRDYGPFWSEFQEVGLNCWLSGGRVIVNKKCHYLHLHKGKKYGRGYRLPESALTTGRNHTMKWIWNEAWANQTLPFEWLIDHFWPVPGWGEDWREVLYATRKPRVLSSGMDNHPDLPDSRQSITDVSLTGPPEAVAGSVKENDYTAGGLVIHLAAYGIGGHPTNDIDVTDRVIELVKNNSLDIVVNNSTLVPGQNPYRGKKKRLLVRYSYNGGEVVDVARDEKDWLIIGQAANQAERLNQAVASNLRRDSIEYVDLKALSDPPRIGSKETAEMVANRDGRTQDVRPAGAYEQAVMAQRPVLYVPDGVHALIPTTPLLTCEVCGGQTKSLMEEPNSRKKVCSNECGDKANSAMDVHPTVITLMESHRGERKQVMQIRRDDKPLSATALNDYLIRKFSISPQRLRAPMPIELRDFHRNDLAQLFAELGLKRGAEIGVAEGNYSEVLLKANPTCELLLVDPWHAYSDNPQNKSKEKHEFAYNETLRKTEGYPNVTIMQDYSMNAVRAIKPEWLDWVYVDANHLFDECVMDIIEWSKRVRSGGIVSGDDYYALDQKRWVGGGVVEAVNAYVGAHGINPWFIFAGHKSTDFFWVRP